MPSIRMKLNSCSTPDRIFYMYVHVDTHMPPQKVLELLKVIENSISNQI